MAVKTSYLLQSKDGVSTVADTLAQATAKTRSGTFSITGYGFGKGSTTARQALRFGRDITFSRMVNVDGCPEFRSDPADVKTALEFIKSAGVLIICKVSKSGPERTHWELARRVDAGAGRVDFVSKSMPEIKAAMKASREKAEIAKATLDPGVIGGKRRRGTLL